MNKLIIGKCKITKEDQATCIEGNMYQDGIYFKTKNLKEVTFITHSALVLNVDTEVKRKHYSNKLIILIIGKFHIFIPKGLFEIATCKGEK